MPEEGEGGEGGQGAGRRGEAGMAIAMNKAMTMDIFRFLVDGESRTRDYLMKSLNKQIVRILGAVWFSSFA